VALSFGDSIISNFRKRQDAPKGIQGSLWSVSLRGHFRSSGSAIVSGWRRSPAGRARTYLGSGAQELYALPDDDSVINARKSLAADPKNVERVLQLSKVEAARRQYREAGATSTEGFYA
jgi:hypothetical protein